MESWLQETPTVELCLALRGQVGLLSEAVQDGAASRETKRSVEDCVGRASETGCRDARRLDQIQYPLRCFQIRPESNNPIGRAPFPKTALPDVDKRKEFNERK